jgi:hypothetical protein|tara:strand:+ start:25958 stop:26227 length:270 start_codon:yes stop_codon:yes gene_type:complete
MQTIIMAKVVYTSDNTYSYIIIFITILLAYGLFKIFNSISKIDEKLEQRTQEMETNEVVLQDIGPSGVTIEEKIQEHIESLETIEEDNK